MVVSNGRDVARGRPVRMSGMCCNKAYPGRHLTDGDHRTMAHTEGGGHLNYMRIDLGREYPIDYVWVLNRKDCCQDRLHGTVIALSGGRRGGSKTYNGGVFQTSDQLGAVSWDQILWQPAIGGVVGPQKVPGSYWAKYDDSDD